MARTARGPAGVRITPGLENRGLMLRSGQHDSAHSALISDFFCWQALWLLLRNLGLEKRRKHEQHARVQPLKLARHYPL